jgi:hypothetical protein
MRQELVEILALVFPSGQGNFPMPGGSSVSSTSSCKRPPAAPPLASRCRGTIRRTTPPPSGNTSPTTELFGTVWPTRGEKIQQRITLDRNDLGGIAYGRANKQSTRPGRVVIIPSWLLSSCLIVCSSRSVRTPAMPGCTTEISQR